MASLDLQTCAPVHQGSAQNRRWPVPSRPRGLSGFDYDQKRTIATIAACLDAIVQAVQLTSGIEVHPAVSENIEFLLAKYSLRQPSNRCAQQIRM
jgi:hypothetical protein